MKVWGMLSREEEDKGFDVVLDDSWCVLLLRDGDVMVRFDPRDYTVADLGKEISRLIQNETQEF